MSVSVRIDMIRCAAHGICAHVLEEHIVLDPWGFPVADRDPIHSARLIRAARRAARACPARALLIEAAAPPGDRPAAR